MEKITMRNGTVIIITQDICGWEATTEENYKSLIKNARNVMKFSNREFENINEVKEYLARL
jgi:hypothetical protein